MNVMIPLLSNRFFFFCVFILMIPLLFHVSHGSSLNSSHQQDDNAVSPSSYPPSSSSSSISPHTPSSSSSSSSSNNCTKLVHQGQCYKNQTYMMDHCSNECYDWQKDMKRVHIAYISEDKPSFFDLQSTNSTGSTLQFRRFEGYVTLVIVIARTCTREWKKIDSIYRGIEYLHHTWPYLLEIIVYFFNHPDMDYEVDCASFHVRFTFRGRKIHVMQVVDINGPNTHPVLQYLKWTMNLHTDYGLSTDLTSFFIINPDGNTIQHVKGVSFDKLKVRIQNTINAEYKEQEEEVEDEGGKHEEEKEEVDEYPEEYKEYLKTIMSYHEKKEVEEMKDSKSEL